MTTNSIALNSSVRKYPHASARYRRVFNETAKELGFGFQWTRDADNPNAVNADELLIGKGEDGRVPPEFDKTLAKQVKSVLVAVEENRLERVQQSLSYHDRHPFRAPVETLRPVEQRAVEHLATKVKPLISTLEALQNDPHAREQKQWVEQHGDFFSRTLFQRYHRDQVAGPLARDSKASLFPFFPEKPEINGLIASDITLQDFRTLSSELGPHAEELRPTTALYRDNQGEIVATPWSKTPEVRGEHTRLSKELDKIANLELDGEKLDPLVQSQMRAWANFFRTGTAEAEKAAVQATIDAGESNSKLRIHMGPSESYWADNTKFPYLLQVGVRDSELQEELTQWKPAFKPVENSLSDIPYYQPRELSLRGGFAEPIYQAVTGGFVETYYAREPRGNNFPNYNYGTEGSNRFILMESLPPLSSKAVEVLNDLVVGGCKAGNEAFNKDVVLFATGHESGHLIGPQRDHKTPNGSSMGAAFGGKWAYCEEPKADLTSLEMMRHRYRSGEISKDERDRFLDVSLGLMLTMSAPKEQVLAGQAPPHYAGYTLELGYYFQSGALRMEDGKIAVDRDKFAESSHDLWKTLIRFQAAGEVEKFNNLGAAL